MVLVAVFTLLAVFSIISIVIGAGDGDRTTDPRDNPFLLATYGRR